MKRVLHTAHIWGPCVVSVVTLVYLVFFAWKYDSRLAYAMGRIDGQNNEIARRTQLESAYRGEVQTWQAYTVKLQTIMIQHGIEHIPSPPQPLPDKEKGE